MEKKIDLTKGSIVKTLVLLSLPIMGTSFIQMAYSMIDMIWVGRIGSDAVAAVGTAGFFTWFAMAFVIISKMGIEIKVSQSVGQKDFKEAKEYIKAAIQINLFFSIIYSLIMIVFKEPLIGFFNLGDRGVIDLAYTYLITVSIGLPFYFINPIFTAMFNSVGNSKMPFYINTCGLIINIVLDPLLIFGGFGLEGFGVLGAALATVLAQIFVSVVFLITISRNDYLFFKVNIFKGVKGSYLKEIIKIGGPTAIQSGLFTFFSMSLGRIIAVFGPVPIAVQKVGSQIESISWMTTDGLAIALGTFVGQNYGAKKYNRVISGYKHILFLSGIIGVISTILLIFFGREIFSIFIPEKEAIEGGANYLRILGFSQIFMCVEITTAGIFNGVSKTYVPSAISILLTGSRVPLAYFLSKPEILGVNGVWYAVTITSILKGILAIIVFSYFYKKDKLFKNGETYNKDEIELECCAK